MSIEELKKFRLAGGTALSLFFGHRAAIDLDLFTDQPLEKDILIPAIENSFGDLIAYNDRKKEYFPVFPPKCEG